MALYLFYTYIPSWREQEQLYPLFLLRSLPLLCHVSCCNDFFYPWILICFKCLKRDLTHLCSLLWMMCLYTPAQFFRCCKTDGLYFSTRHALCIQSSFVLKVRRLGWHYELESSHLLPRYVMLLLFSATMGPSRQEHSLFPPGNDRSCPFVLEHEKVAAKFLFATKLLLFAAGLWWYNA